MSLFSLLIFYKELKKSLPLLPKFFFNSIASCLTPGTMSQSICLCSFPLWLLYQNNSGEPYLIFQSSLWLTGFILNNPLWFFFFKLYYMACRILVPWPGIEPTPSAVKMQSPNHWTTRKFPTIPCFYSVTLLVKTSKPRWFWCASSCRIRALIGQIVFVLVTSLRFYSLPSADSLLKFFLFKFWPKSHCSWIFTIISISSIICVFLIFLHRL